MLVRPRHAGNLGAAVRVAAAAEAAGVLAVGGRDPWEPEAIRGAAGLQYALPVARLDDLPSTDRPLVAVDPGGDPAPEGGLPPRALLAFGTERHGLGEALLSRADLRVAIPMREGVSSLNLATAVAVALYAWRRSG
jgi:TrmH family RNA methyltransferase